MKNTLSLIGAIVVGIGVIVTAAILVKKYVDKTAKKKKEADFCECDGNCCDLGFDDEDGINWDEIPVEDDEEIAGESIKELDNLDAE